MARQRMIRPEFWESSDMGAISFPARLLFIAMWNFADDYGYLKNDEKWLKVKCFPYDDEIEIESLVDELLEIKVIDVRNDIIKVCNFNKYQKIDNRGKSDLPDKFSENFAEIPPNPAVSHPFPPNPAPEVKRSEKKGKEVNKTESLNEQESKQENKAGGDPPQSPPFLSLDDETANDKDNSNDNCNGKDVDKMPDAFIADCSPATFKSRVNYAKSLGIKDNIAMAICNIAQSKKLVLTRDHYDALKDKTETEIKEMLALLARFIEKQKSLRSGKTGFSRLGSSG